MGATRWRNAALTCCVQLSVPLHPPELQSSKTCQAWVPGSACPFRKTQWVALGREAAFVSTTEGKTLIFSRAGKMQTQSEPRNQEASPHPILAKGPGVSMCVWGGGGVIKGGQGDVSTDEDTCLQSYDFGSVPKTHLVKGVDTFLPLNEQMFLNKSEDPKENHGDAAASLGGFSQSWAALPMPPHSHRVTNSAYLTTSPSQQPGPGK